MKLPHAIEVYLLAKEISGFSPNTLRNYRLTLNRLTGSSLAQRAGCL